MDLKVKWNEENYTEFLKYLKSFEDLKYREFHTKIVNDNTAKYIGIRTPQLRKIAKIIANNDYEGFIKFNKHEFCEEKILHGFITGYAKIDYKTLMDLIKDFIPYLSSWALVDMFVTKFPQIQSNKNEALEEIIKFTKSLNPWEIRLGLMLLLSNYLGPVPTKKIKQKML